MAIDLYPRWEIRCILIVGLQHLEELYPSFPEMFPEVPAKLAFWRLPKRFARKVRIEPCHNPVQDSIMSFNACDSHPKMLYRVAAVCRSVTEAGVFPFQRSQKEELEDPMSDQRVDTAPSSVPDPTRQMRPSNASEPSSSTTLLGGRSTIGKSLLIKGEITGSESLYIEGKVEGSIDLPGDRVTVGRNGRVSANIAAQDIVVLGELLGNCKASDHLDIRSKGSLFGDVIVSRISVEDGAFLTGSIDIRRESAPEAVENEESAPEAVENEQVEFSHVN